jgi:hypothetical protein
MYAKIGSVEILNVVFKDLLDTACVMLCRNRMKMEF